VAQERQGDRSLPTRHPCNRPGGRGLFSLVYGFSHAETTAWSNHFTVGFLVLGVLLLATFYVVETRVIHPLLPLRVVLNRTRGGSMLAILFAGAGIFGVFFFLTYYLLFHERILRPQH
jgi:hypothetical protein